MAEPEMKDWNDYELRDEVGANDTVLLSDEDKVGYRVKGSVIAPRTRDYLIITAEADEPEDLEDGMIWRDGLALKHRLGSVSYAFVLDGATQTLTGKTFSLAYNLLAGTKAQFNAAVTNGTFVFTGDAIAMSAITGLDAALVGKASTATASTSANGLMSSSDKSKLNGIATGANNYTHPTTDGNRHVPATASGDVNKFLKSASTAGNAPSWAAMAIADIANLQSLLDAKQISSEKGQANGYASLDSSGKVPEAQLPAIAITDTFVVSSQSAMLALTAQIGDIAIRSDQSKSYVLRASPSTTLSNWSELLSPTGGVSSVAASGGSTGLSFSGGPITGSGTLTLGGTLAVGSGGTGATSAAAARTNLGLGNVDNVKQLPAAGGTHSGGFTSSSSAAHSLSGTSITPTVSNGHTQRLTASSSNWTLNAPTGSTTDYDLEIQVTNPSGGAGELNPSGFDYSNTKAYKQTASAVFIFLIKVRGARKTLRVMVDS